MEPTDAGDILYSKSKNLLEAFKEVEDCLSEGELNHRATVKAAFTYGSMTFLGTSMVSAFSRQNPNIELSTEEYPDDNVDKLLRSGEADVGLIAGPIDTTFYSASLIASIRHVVVAPISHRIAKCKKVAYRDLEGERIIMISRQFRPYHNNLNRFAKAGVTPKEVFETNEINKISQEVAHNGCLGISVEFEAVDNPYPNTVILPFEDESCTFDIYLVVPSAKPPSTATIDFCNFLLAWVKGGKAFFSEFDYSKL
jgi:DNA-binding transcriptional LysR family regulator